MGKLSFGESVRVWLGGVAFDVFLWSVRMSADDYFDMIQTDGGLTQRTPDAPKSAPVCTCSMDDGIHEWNCALEKARR